MSTFLKQSDYSKVGYEESMWKTTVNGYDILLTTHIDDFILACRDRPTLDDFRSRLLDHFDGSYEGEIRTYLGCEMERDIAKGTTSLSQKHYDEGFLRTYNAWDYHPSATFPPTFVCGREITTFILIVIFTHGIVV